MPSKLSDFLTARAANRERQGPKALLGDLVTALVTVTVRPFVMARQRFPDLPKRFRPHLKKREFNIVLNLGV